MYKMEYAMPEPQPRPQRHPSRKRYEKKRDHSHKKRTTSENSMATIEDSFKAIYLQDKDATSKTHVSILQEVLSRHGATPNYELVRIEGLRHEPTFNYRVWFNDKDAIGVGKSKKEAKHAAAKAIIDKMIGVSNTTTTTTLNSNINNDLNSSLENNVFGNPIGWLQELCTARHWPPPRYEIDTVLGRPHDRQFKIACVVAKYREVGQGRSKKIAKLLAAYKLWTVIEKEIYAKSKTNQDLDDSGFSEICPGINYIQYLQEIAAVNQIDVKYKIIEDKARRFQCLVNLSTIPETNCHGTGVSRNEAYLDAAHNAVVYLKALSLSLFSIR